MTPRRAALARALASALAGAALVAAAAPAAAQQASPPSAQAGGFKVAFIDPLSGPFAAVGELMLAHIEHGVAAVNAAGGVARGVRMELLKYDGKLSAQDSLTALQAAIDQGAKVVFTGGSGSTVVSALVEAAARHNQRNPERPVIVVNHSSIDPELTGKRCNFWHFQLEANTAMKMKALANFAKRQPAIKDVYLLNQDYAHGRQWATYGKELVHLARPDVKFVGEDLHPIGRVKDFAPYIQKIKQAGADTVITGNWGPDMTLLLKAAGEFGLDLRYFNHSAGAIPGTVLAVSQAKRGQLTWVAEWHPGQQGTPRVDALAKSYKSGSGGRDFLAPRIEMAPRFVAAAVAKAQSTEPLKIARAMEDLVFDTALGPLRMRGEDHQLLLPQVVNTIAPVDGKTVTAGYEGTDYGFRTDATYSGNELAQGTECRMARP